MSYSKQEPETIQEMFGSIAPHYDKTNAVLSFGMHQLWNKRLINQVRNAKHGTTLLDLCCGTGEIGLGWLKQQQEASQLYLLDFCSEMLDCAKQKKWDILHQVEFIQADAQQIPLSDQSVEAVTISYGIRNVANPKTCFKEVYRVLKPEGVFGILELTEPSNPLIRSGHHLYLKHFLPKVGGWMTSNPNAYSYLSKSIPHFSKPSELELLLHEAGFKTLAIQPFFGGIATLLLSQK